MSEAAAKENLSRWKDAPSIEAAHQALEQELNRATTRRAIADAIDALVRAHIRAAAEELLVDVGS